MNPLKMYCTFRKILMLGVILLITSNSRAQFIGYRIDEPEKKSVFNFQFINNLIIVPIVLNDSVEMQFILDTGVRTTLLTEGNDNHLDVSYNRPVKISGLGTSGDIQAYVASNVKLQLPGITGKGQTLIVLGEDYLNLQSHIGQEVHGILGYDFFSHFVVRIDYISKKITVYESNSFILPSDKFTRFPISIAGGRPFLQAEIIQMDGAKTHGSFLIDTGASHSLLLEPSTEKGIFLPSKTLPTIVGWGLSGPIPGRLGRIKLFTLGKFSFKNTLASFGDCMQPASQSLPDRIGSIGGELLSRFTVIFDYKSEQMFLKKNYHYKRGFEHNKSGIDLVADGESFKTFKVAHVMENSPASTAGIMEGDIIVAINGKGAAQLDLEEIHGIFRSDISQPVQLIILRGRKYQSFSLRLKKMI
ncbi:MAG: periplasmic protease [Bacteroidetes bacterium]|nr:MAG: periplasmic protease [Bacteroidota bacterium]